MLASTVDPIELWPMILSKAIYTLLGATPLSERSGDLFGLSFPAKDAAVASSALFSFVIHALSG